jgi:hypothetical protein
MKPEEIIKNSRLITDIYGEWPSFHDYEITKVVFERNIEKDEDGPFITIFIHMWKVTGKSDDGKKIIFGKHNIAEIRCNNVAEYKLNEFNQQNVIDDIDISEEEHDKTKYTVIRFPCIFGADILIKCRTIEVLSVKQEIPRYSVYEK